MPEVLKSMCMECGTALGKTHHVFALQKHQIGYSQPGETPSEQALLTASTMTTIARFCSAPCCKNQLGELLQAQGLPVALQKNRVYGGPIAPCGKCGKPVDMSQPHGAWIKGKVTADLQMGEDSSPHWLDILTVVCTSCLEFEAVAGECIQATPKPTFEQLLAELEEMTDPDFVDDDDRDDGADPDTEKVKTTRGWNVDEL